MSAKVVLSCDAPGCHALVSLDEPTIRSARVFASEFYAWRTSVHGWVHGRDGRSRLDYCARHAADYLDLSRPHKP